MAEEIRVSTRGSGCLRPCGHAFVNLHLASDDPNGALTPLSVAGSVSTSSASPILEPTKHILDLVALTVERPVMLDWFLAICF